MLDVAESTSLLESFKCPERSWQQRAVQLQDGAGTALGNKQNEKEKGVTGKETGGSTTLRCREESSSRQKGKLQLIFEEEDLTMMVQRGKEELLGCGCV